MGSPRDISRRCHGHAAKVLALALLAAPAAASDPSCEPSLSLQGDPSLVRLVGDELGARGYGVAGKRPPCQVVQGWLEPSDLGIRLQVLDAQGQHHVYQIGDAKTAARLLASHSRGDLVDPLLSRRVPLPAPAMPTLLSDEVTLETPAPDFMGFLGLSSELFYTPRGALGGGLRAAASVPARRVHLGLLGRLDRTFMEHRSGRGFLASALMLSLDLPQHIWRLELVPGLAVGPGLLLLDAPAPQGQPRALFDIRTDAHLSSLVPINDILAVELGISLTFMPALASTPGQLLDALSPRAVLGLRYGVAKWDA